METDEEPIERLAALAGNVDTAFERIRGRNAERMQCRAGCAACCRARLSISRVEEAFLRRGLSTLPDARRAELSARTRRDDRQACPALDDDGRCGVYAFRPLICRSYGVPLRHRKPVALVNPPVLDVCDLNFRGTRLKVLPPEDVFDQTAVVEAVETIDGDYCQARGLPARGRVPLADVLRR